MYNSGCDYLLSLKILFVYFLALPSLLHPSLLFTLVIYMYGTYACRNEKSTLYTHGSISKYMTRNMLNQQKCMRKASVGMYSGCDTLSLQCLPSLLHPSILFNTCSHIALHGWARAMSRNARTQSQLLRVTHAHKCITVYGNKNS